MADGKFNVGGVLLDQPFKIRRLGHFGFNMTNMAEGRRFYTDLLGFKISDVMDYSSAPPVLSKLPASATLTVTSPATAATTTPWCYFQNACATHSAVPKSPA
jgi:catechol 2,3-dioxygenase-like lactoylglutathione lyase family enzyme